MIAELLALVALILAGVPASMVLVNIWLYRRPTAPNVADPLPQVSVLVPARDEEDAIAGCVDSVLRSRGVELEVVVVDDHSRDRTAEIVRGIAARDSRVRLESAPPLPDGWCGKQHACHTLARHARHPLLAFVDADVRIEPQALAAMAAFLEHSGAGLVSGIPHQRTGSWLEKLVVPLIHFVLLGFLPLVGMRRSRRPSFAAGCGQLMLAERAAYRQAGGHAAIRASRHDGLTLPRAFRRAGLHTDLFDATALASCRMYRNAGQVWHGFAKNATEGMAAPAAIVPWTVLLAGGQVLPVLLAGALLETGGGAAALGYALGGAALAWATRLALALRFRQSPLGALLHPLGVLIVLAIQWYALLRHLTGRDVAWKGRVHVAG